MESFEAQAVILAPSSIVRDILTDQGNYPVWNSGLAEIQGDIVHGARLRVRLTGAKRTLPLRVKRFDGDHMVWTGRRALGLLTFVRTFTVADHSGLTMLKVRDTFSGPLWKLLRRTTDGTPLPLSEFVDEVKFRSELLGFHFHDGIFPSTSVPRHQSDRHRPALQAH
ncbi:hypothetical protein [Arthrobacter sp. ZGTC412]|uniref:hypothetical protein n=1 Tax=Arthrobacter sp. ZGTC412 TaxID=2058900 RepID=UPI000CE4DA06|nr:hypothetical protein [Arthrobacter sp. ZGTC412]